MSNTIKNYLGLVLILALLSLIYGAVAFTQSYSAKVDPYSQAGISVTGEGKVIADPDVAQFTFGVITEGSKDTGKLSDENNKKVNQIIDFVKSNKVDSKDIQTVNYTLDPRYQYSTCSPSGEPCPPPTIVGYTITQTVKIKVRNLDKAGFLLSGVVQRGANSVSQITFSSGTGDGKRPYDKLRRLKY